MRQYERKESNKEFTMPPAARIGDMTAHGGSIVVGFPQVLIGGMPAARLGDMHVCPMVNPGTPPPPHVGGPITKGSSGVMIGGQPAARVGDMCTCSGPPDSIVAGCFTVLIGEAGGGGGAGSSGSGGSGAIAAQEQTAAETEAGEVESGEGTESESETQGHYIQVTAVDSAGFPITDCNYRLKAPNGDISGGLLAGGFKESVTETGNYELTLRAIVTAVWSKTTAKVGETVRLTAETAGLKDGAKARLEIWIYDPNYSTERLKIIESKISGNKVESEWLVEVDDDMLAVAREKEIMGRFSMPQFYFVVTVGNFSKRSGMLTIIDDLEFELKDEFGNPIPDKEYSLYLPNGAIRTGNLDGSGKGKETDLPAGSIRVSFDIKDEEWTQ